MTEESLFTLIRTKYHTLSPTQKTIADYVLTNSENAMLLSISDLAAECQTSVTTVTRCFQKLGFSSYQVFRVKMAQEVSLRSPQAIYENIKGQDINTHDSMLEIKGKVMSSIVNSINDLASLIDEASLTAAVDLIYQANQILFFGCGGSAIVAQDAFHKFLRLGLRVITETSEHLMFVHCAHTTPQDVLFLVSHSGETKSVLECARIAKANGAKTLALTSYRTSALAGIADAVLLSSTRERKYHTDAMISRIVQLAIIDMLYVPVVLKLGNRGIKNINKSRLAVAFTKT